MSKAGTCLLVVFVLTLAQFIVIYSYPKTQDLTSMQVFHIMLVFFQFFAVILTAGVLSD